MNLGTAGTGPLGDAEHTSWPTWRRALGVVSLVGLAPVACTSRGEPATPASSAPPTTVASDRVEGDGTAPLLVGDPIDVATPPGRIVFDDYEDVYSMRPDGTALTRLPIDVWFEYPSFSPDGTRIVFMGHAGADYDIYVAEVASGEVTRLTDAAGADGWPAWSPDGTRIAFTTERDDCARAPEDEDCWHGDEPGEHHDIWVMDAVGTDQHRVSPEAGQFVAWSPDGQHLLVSGRTLFVIRPDGTGRVELRADRFPAALGGLPDWTG